MPISIQMLSEQDLTTVFGRRPRGAENVDDYIDLLESQSVAVGKGFSLKTVVVTPDEGDSYTILDGSVDDDDPAGITVRAAKRRFNLAAKELGYSLAWRESTGWLSAKAVELEVEVTDGQTTS